ncbi:MAG: 6-bladed beta-propeller, partial [Muribaculaceae bacterium]|nr:6-bladed beta-propeller [Muribaculaceae bacterium]
MKKLLSSVIIPAFMTACSGGGGNYSGSITPAQPSVVPDKPDSIEVWTPNDKPSEHDLIDGATEECKYVFLQSDTPKSIIGCINQIFVDDSTFTITDKSVTEKIVRFNKFGDYIQSIGSKGKARGEYIGLGCTAKTGDGNLAVIDIMSNKFIIYSPDGKPVDEFRMNKQMPHEMIMTDSLVLGSFPGYHKSSKYRLKWFNLEGKDVHTAFPFTSTRKYVAGHLLKDSDGDIHYNFSLNDTIFRIDNLRIIPEIVMNIHDQELTDRFIKDTETLDEKKYYARLYQDENIVNLVDLIKCDNKWVVYYQKGSK